MAHDDGRESPDPDGKEPVPTPPGYQVRNARSTNTVAQRALFVLCIVFIVEAIWVSSVIVAGLGAQIGFGVGAPIVLAGGVSLFVTVHREDLRDWKLTSRTLIMAVAAALVVLMCAVGVVLRVPRAGTMSTFASTTTQPDPVPIDQFELQARWHSPTWENAIKVDEAEAVVEILIYYKNRSNTQHNDVTFTMNLPPGVHPLPGSIYFNAEEYGDTRVPDTLWSDGVNIGNYAPGGGTYIVASIQFDPKIELPCGESIVPLQAFGRASDIPSYKEWTSNQLVITYFKDCKTNP
jgi:hypothetical protein